MNMSKRVSVPISTLRDRKSCHRDASKEAVLSILLAQVDKLVEMVELRSSIPMTTHSDRKCCHGEPGKETLLAGSL